MEFLCLLGDIDEDDNVDRIDSSDEDEPVKGAGKGKGRRAVVTDSDDDSDNSEVAPVQSKKP